MQKEPLVSVIIPLTTGSNTFLEAIESVKIQNYKNIEIIVINDGSTQKEYYNFEFDKK